jgi:serine phosphatase RsbU (regulator of sigma subunit)
MPELNTSPQWHADTATEQTPMHFSEEWLTKHLAALPTDGDRLLLIMSFVNSSSDFLREYTDKLCEELAAKAEETNDDGLRAFLEVRNGYARLTQGNVVDFTESIRHAERLAMSTSLSTPANVAIQMCAFMYWNSGHRDKAFELAYYARRQMQEMQGEALGWNDYQLAVFHSDLKDFETSKRYFRSAEAVASKQPHLAYQLARIHSGLGVVAIEENDLTEALRYNELALKGYRECGHLTALSRVLNDLGVIYYRNGDVPRAKAHLEEAMDIRKKSNYIPGLITSQIELARIYLAENALPGAEALLKEALELSNFSGARQKVMTCHMMLATLYKTRGEYEHALTHLEEGYKAKDELSGEEATNKVKRLQQKFATEQADHEAEIHRLKNVELKQAYDAIEDQNKSILDSITYARRIQSALLGSRSLFHSHFRDSFVLYRPKDIVSGDFWWCAEQDNKFWFAVADCTGHGVPGAFMSLLNINLLNRALNENSCITPAEVLNETRLQVIRSLNHDDQETSRDGMDVVLCAYDPARRELQFACANNALVHVRAGVMNMHGPDKFHVGLSHGTELPGFTHRMLYLEPGDAVYLSTDGFADQFGGEKGKKLKQKRLRALFRENAGLSAERQEQLFSETFDTWKGELEQVDDVLVMGIRID